MFDTLKSIRPIKFPDALKSEFIRDLIGENLARITISATLLYLVEIVLFIFRDRLFGAGPAILAFLACETIGLPVYWYAKSRVDRLPLWLLRMVQMGFALSVILFGEGVVFLTQTKVDLIHVYLMCVMFVTAFIGMRSKDRLFLYISTLAVFFIGISYYQKDQGLVFVEAVNVSVFYVFPG